MGKKRRLISNSKFNAKFKNHPIILERSTNAEDETPPVQPALKIAEPMIVEEAPIETVLVNEKQEKVAKLVATTKKTKKAQKPAPSVAKKQKPATLKAAPKTTHQPKKQKAPVSKKTVVKKTKNKLTE